MSILVLIKQTTNINEVVEIKVGSVIHVVHIYEVGFSDSLPTTQNEDVSKKLGGTATDWCHGSQSDSSSESGRRQSLECMDIKNQRSVSVLEYSLRKNGTNRGFCRQLVKVAE
ncbi:hypothetical protein V6N13_061925 [Hibiscus sabdariffa]|uniref:Uncharacterized protein n=2 Tax=Hibiscus sabdariffa TaxID=183260 RepID=A0ABR2PEW2_9ROSI